MARCGMWQVAQGQPENQQRNNNRFGCARRRPLGGFGCEHWSYPAKKTRSLPTNRCSLVDGRRHAQATLRRRAGLQVTHQQTLHLVAHCSIGAGVPPSDEAHRCDRYLLELRGYRLPRRRADAVNQIRMARRAAIRGPCNPRLLHRPSPPNKSVVTA